MAVGTAVLGIFARIHAAWDASQTPAEMVASVQEILQIS